MTRKRRRRQRIIPITKYPFTPDTYPGRRPRFSFFFTPQGIYRLQLRTLNQFLADRGLAPLEERYAILAYGSNASPGQLLRKYQNHGLTNVPVLFGRLVGAEAVYARRITDGGYVPATLASRKGSRMTWITLLAANQLEAMDMRVVSYREFNQELLLKSRHLVRKASTDEMRVYRYLS
jgi:hypothetical protein